MYSICEEELAEFNTGNLKKAFQCCKHVVRNYLGHLEEVHSFTLKSYIHDHIVNDISKFVDLSNFDASSNEHFNVTIKSL